MPLSPFFPLDCWLPMAAGVTVKQASDQELVVRRLDRCSWIGGEAVRGFGAGGAVAVGVLSQTTSLVCFAANSSRDPQQVSLGKESCGLYRR